MGGKKFQNLVNMRNELAHPKSIRVTLLHPKLPNTVMSALSWFYGNMVDFTNSIDTVRLQEDFQRTVDVEEFRRVVDKWREEIDSQQGNDEDEEE